MPVPSAKQAKEMADKMTVATLMMSGWQHTMTGHYNFDNPAVQPDPNKSYFTIPMGGRPKGNDMGVCLIDACGSSRSRPRTICLGAGTAILVYRSSIEARVVGKTKAGGDCAITCAVLDKDQSGKVYLATAYPVNAIVGTPLI